MEEPRYKAVQLKGVWHYTDRCWKTLEALASTPEANTGIVNFSLCPSEFYPDAVRITPDMYPKPKQEENKHWKVKPRTSGKLHFSTAKAVPVGYFCNDKTVYFIKILLPSGVGCTFKRKFLSGDVAHKLATRINELGSIDLQHWDVINNPPYDYLKGRRISEGVLNKLLDSGWVS